ncbi:MAG: (2Fe-2S) ferredoxin domain-containing protein [Oscillospiraceae bacterium]|jgi:NADP-reducing hydrogenase subunit HndB|nr:(2Fe-2S) ferredoxin domain-containing protein [Oscillospiraceae bacterium]
MKSLEELKAIKAKMQGQVGIRENAEDGIRVVVGMATCGIAAGARPVLAAFADGVQSKGIKNVSVTQTGCIGLCQYEPIVEIYAPGKEKVTYIKVDAKMANEIVDKHLVRGTVVDEYTIGTSKLAE